MGVWNLEFEIGKNLDGLVGFMDNSRDRAMGR